MMFKVGDKVKCLKCGQYGIFPVYVGAIGVVESIETDDITVKFSNGNTQFGDLSDFELVTPPIYKISYVSEPGGGDFQQISDIRGKGAPIKSTPHKCTCDIRDIMTVGHGCKCGGC